MQEAIKKYKVDDRGLNWDYYHSIQRLEVHEGGKHIQELCELLGVNCWVYRLKVYEKYSRMVVEHKYGVLKKVTVHVFYTGMNWCWLKKTKLSRRVKGLERMYCHTCFRWLHCELNADGIAQKKWFKKNHINDCIRCGCGRAYTRGDSHAIHCNKRDKRKKFIPTPLLACRKYEPSKEPSYTDYVHHCDFECIPSRDETYFEVDSVGFWNDTPAAKKYMDWCGKGALEDWMHYINEHIEGQIWFFYGSKFDAFFILEQLIRKNHIPLDMETTMISGNMVYCLGLIGKKGLIVIKDLTKFLAGSLKWNCIAFGIPAESSKTDFDHEKVKTWDDVEEHKEERLAYLKLDVIAQREVFKKFADVIWEYDKLNVSDFISMAQLANAITTLYIPPGRLFKLKVEDEAPFREAYYGGRLVLTRPYWESSDLLHIWMCESDEELSRFYIQIGDFVMYFDANSLYPSQMKNKRIACGNPYHISVFNIHDSNACIMSMEREAKIEEDNPKAQWGKRLILVDIDCPNDILIPFLMRRDENGNNIQTLDPIRFKWYAGPEILEAIRIGYKVIRVYAYYHFPLYEKLFEKFVNDNYALRKKHPGTAIDLSCKNKLNGASGKGGQKGRQWKTLLHIGEEQILYAKARKSNQTERIIYDEKEKKILAAVCKEEQILESTPHSLATTVWILAESRVYMSTFLRKIGGYRSVKACPYYGDTDSLFLHNSVVEPMLVNPATKDLFGKELGQFKNEIPHGKIVGLIVLAPKTKIQLMVIQKYKRDGKRGPHLLSHPEGRKVKVEGKPILLEGQYELMCQMTCKGIPHYSKPYRYDGNYNASEEETVRIRNVFGFMKERAQIPTKEKTYAKHVKLKDRYYVFEENGKEPLVRGCITWQDAYKVQHKQGSLTCVFGTMQRNLVSFCDLEKNGIALDYQKRNVSEQSWWEKGRRIQVEGDLMTYPIGYKLE